jgi:hypothetical protein
VFGGEKGCGRLDWARGSPERWDPEPIWEKKVKKLVFERSFVGKVWVLEGKYGCVGAEKSG